jgi:sortase A
MSCTIKRRISPSRRSRYLLRWSRNFFLAAGISILGYCGYVLIDAKFYQESETRRFQQQISDFKSGVPGGGRVEAASVHQSAGNPLGEIELTRIGVTAMILEGTDELTLRRAVGHISGTPLPGQPGNVGIAGHRDTFFRALRHVQQNDEITLMTVHGSYRYRVDSIKVVGPEDTRVLDPTDADVLTLVTCFPFYFVGPAPKRFIVRAQRISSP